MSTPQLIEYEIGEVQRLPRPYAQGSPRYYKSRRRLDDTDVIPAVIDYPVATDDTVVIPAVTDDTASIPAVTDGPTPDEPRTRHRVILAGVLLIASAGVGGYYMIGTGMGTPPGGGAVPGTPSRISPPPDFAKQPPLLPAEVTSSPTDHTVQLPTSRVHAPSASPRRSPSPSPSPSRSPSARPSSASPSPTAPQSPSRSPSRSPTESTSPPPSPAVTPDMADHEKHKDHKDWEDRPRHQSVEVSQIRYDLGGGAVRGPARLARVP